MKVTSVIRPPALAPQWFNCLMGVMLFFVSAQSFAVAPTSTKRGQFQTLASIIQELDTHYGMTKRKEADYGVTLEELQKKYSRLIGQAITLEEFHGYQPRVKRDVLPVEEFEQLMIGLVAEFRDGHTSLIRATTSDIYTIGIKTAVIQGRLVISGFIPDLYVPRSTSESLKEGDVVIEVDGKSIDAIARENILYAQQSTYISRDALARRSILNVPHAFMRAKKIGTPVKLKVLRHLPDGSTKMITGTFKWLNIHDFAKHNVLAQFTNPDGSQGDPDFEQPYSFGEMGKRDSQFTFGLAHMELGPGVVTDLGSLQNTEIASVKAQIKKGNLALKGHDLAKLKPTNRFQALMVRTQDKNIAVLRIPSFDANSSTPNGTDTDYEWIKLILRKFQNSADALIIDLNSNPGGSLDFANRFLSLFAGDRELKTVSLDARLSRTLLQSLEESVFLPDESYENPVTFGRIRLGELGLNFLKDKLPEGWSGPIPAFFSTNLDFSSQGVGTITQGDISFTLPTVVLLDGRSASAAEFVASILQANGKALVAGGSSMGLFGPVYRNTEIAELSIRCTLGDCELPTRQSLEGVGVPVDVRREIMLSDFRDGFSTYAHTGLHIAYLLADGRSPAEIQEIIGGTQNGEAFPLEPSELVGNELDTEKADQLITKTLDATIKHIAELQKQDRILASLVRADAILDRLNDMKQLKAYQASLPLIDQAIHGIQILKLNHLKSQCGDLLNAENRPAQPTSGENAESQ